MMQTDPLEQLRREKRRVRKELCQSRERIQQQFHRLSHPVAKNTDRVSRLTGYVQNGLAIWQGIRLGLLFIRAFRKLR